MLCKKAMLVIACLVFTVFNSGIAGKLPTLNGATSHQVYYRNTTYENNLDAIAGVRAFIHEDEAASWTAGGKEAWPHSWPWQVVLSFAHVPVCGGAILNRYWIVTASHCVKRYTKESLWLVSAGKHDLRNETESCQQDAKVDKIITHKGYNSITKQHDIALLKLQTPLLFDECVRPVPVRSTDLPSLNRCTVTGWGSTIESGPQVNRLQEANVTILESDTCVIFYGGLIHSSMVCAGDMTGLLDACQGDSGSPLSCFTGKGYELAGIVSWGAGCGQTWKPGVYTKVVSYIKWINSIIDAVRSMQVTKCGQAKVKPCRLDQGYIGFKSSEPSGEQRLVNLTEACPHSWPWQVSLQREDSHYCSGTLIDKRWVLTSRHCRVVAGDTVVLGAHELNSTGSQYVSVKAVYSQAYDSGYPPLHDIALINLSVPARLGSSVFPVCIPDKDMRFDHHSSCVTTGWGYKTSTSNLSPNVLHQALVNPLQEQACWSGWGQIFSSSVLLCTQPAASSSCLGDAGAPLLCQKNGWYYLAGMMALEVKWCDLQKPAIFTSLSSFRSWIENIMTNEGL